MSIKPLSITVPHPSTQRGHATHISYDPVNERLAYVNGKSVIIRPVDFKSTSPTVVFSKHIFPTTAVKFSPSGYYVASGDEAGNIKIWDASPKSEPDFEQPVIKSEFQVMSGPIRSIAWDADNSRIIAVGQGKEKFGHAFSWDSGNSVGDIQGHSSPINAVDIKPQRPYRAATVGDDHALVFFTGPPFKFDKSLRGNHNNVVRDVKFSPDGEYIVSVGSDRVIAIYQGKTGEFVKKIEKAHEGGIFAVAWLPDSKHFITASADNTLKKWTLDGENTQKFEINSTTSVGNQQVGLALTKEFVVSLSGNGNLNYFDHEGNLVQIVQGHQSPITKVEFHDGFLLSGGSDGKLFKWEVGTDGPKALPVLQDDDEHSNYVVDILTVDDVTYTTGWDDTLKSWRDGKVVSSVKLPSQPKQLGSIKGAVFVLFESALQLYTEVNFQLIAETKFDFTATYAAPTNDTHILITNTTSNTVEEFQVGNGEIRKTSKEFPKSRSPPTFITVSPSREFFAVADSAGKYTLFNTSDGTVVSTRWAFHNSKVFDAKWTSDSKYLISGGLDSSLLLYSVEKPSRVVKYLLAHPSGISSIDWVAYDSEKKTGTFVSAGLDATIRSWNISI